MVLCKKFAGRRVCRLYSLLHIDGRSVASVASGMHPSLRGVVVLVVTRSVFLLFGERSEHECGHAQARGMCRGVISQSEAM